MSIATYQAVQGIVYSPKLLSRAGVAIPKQSWTWNDFREAALKASQPPDTWGLSFAWIMHHLLSWMGTMGASYVSADKRKMTVSSPEFVSQSEKLNVRPAFLPAEDFSALVAREDAELSRLMQQIGLKKPPASAGSQ